MESSETNLLKFPIVATSSASTVIVENGVSSAEKLRVWCGIKDRNLWLICEGNFIRILVWHHQRKCQEKY
jgi:hypothetical protein